MAQWFCLADGWTLAEDTQLFGTWMEMIPDVLLSAALLFFFIFLAQVESVKRKKLRTCVHFPVWLNGSYKVKRACPFCSSHQTAVSFDSLKAVVLQAFCPRYWSGELKAVSSLLYTSFIPQEGDSPCSPWSSPGAGRLSVRAQGCLEINVQRAKQKILPGLKNCGSHIWLTDEFKWSSKRAHRVLNSLRLI